MTPISLSPLKDELLSSWLIRSSIANGNDPSGWCGGIWENWRTWTRDIDRAVNTEKLYKLSTKVKLSIKELKNLTLEPIIEKILNNPTLNYKVGWKWVIPIGGISRTKTNGLHFCPDCLLDKNIYFKKQWRLSWNIGCIKHNKFLLLHCPNCNSCISPHLINYINPQLHICQTCGYDLSSIETNKPNKEVLILQENLNTLAFKNIKPNKLYPLIDKDISTQEFFQFIRELMLFFYRLRHQQKNYQLLLKKLKIEDFENFSQKSYGKTIDLITTKERHSLLYVISKLLQIDLSTISSLLYESNISVNMLFIKNTSESILIKELSKTLELRVRNYTKRELSPIKIKAKSKKEIEDAMNKIRKFI